MPDENKPTTDGQQTTQKDVAALTEQIKTLSDKVKSLTEAAQGHEARVGALRSTLVTKAKSEVYVGVIDPDVLGLAPAITLDDAGQVTADSMRAAQAWRASKAHFFPAAAVATPVAEPAPVAPAKPSIPPVNQRGTELTWDYWDQLKDKHPEVWRDEETQKKYIAWALSDQAQRR